MLLLHNNGTTSFILLSSQSHHFNLKSVCICSCENLYFMCFAGFPPTIVYGSTFLTTWLLQAIIEPSPIKTPDIIVTLSPIQTSLPTITLPLLNGCPFSLTLKLKSYPVVPNGYVVIQSVL